jgi:uncharacterized membrane protein YphA (DoxX/SURF4 family)
MSLLNGLFPSQDITLLALRFLVGWFYLLARFRWVYDPYFDHKPWFPLFRTVSLKNKMGRCGYPRWFAGPVAITEIISAILLIVGFMSVPAAWLLFCITLAATKCTAVDKILEQSPIDKVDWVSCYLWRVEGLYLIMALLLSLNGPGRISIDFLLF